MVRLKLNPHSPKHRTKPYSNNIDIVIVSMICDLIMVTLFFAVYMVLLLAGICKWFEDRKNRNFTAICRGRNLPTARIQSNAAEAKKNKRQRIEITKKQRNTKAFPNTNDNKNQMEILFYSSNTGTNLSSNSLLVPSLFSLLQSSWARGTAWAYKTQRNSRRYSIRNRQMFHSFDTKRV